MNALTEVDLDALADYDRMAALASYDLRNPDLVEELDAIAENTAHTLRQPIALTNLVLDTAAMVKGSYGLDAYGDAANVPAEWSFCVRVVREGAPRIIPDFTKDPEGYDHPLVVSTGIRSYASVPLSTPGGHVIGTHCVFGMEPREFDQADVEALKSAAAEVITTLERYALD